MADWKNDPKHWADLEIPGTMLSEWVRTGSVSAAFRGTTIDGQPVYLRIALPRFSTRRASLRARAMSVTLRSPKLMQ